MKRRSQDNPKDARTWPLSKIVFGVAPGTILVFERKHIFLFSLSHCLLFLATQPMIHLKRKVLLEYKFRRLQLLNDPKAMVQIQTMSKIVPTTHTRVIYRLEASNYLCHKRKAERTLTAKTKRIILCWNEKRWHCPK